MNDCPLVSAIMPTRARPHLAPKAIECFLAQTWPNKELVIVDDENAPSFSTSPSGSNIRYIVERHKLSIGAKRNRACAEASGEIICHWDDDDFSAPDRIDDQITRLLENGVDMTGYSEMEFRDGAKTWLYRGTNGYMLGTSMMYRRSAWRARPFPDNETGEDLIFQAGRKSIAVPAGARMFARRNHKNDCHCLKHDTVRWSELQCA